MCLACLAGGLPRASQVINIFVVPVTLEHSEATLSVTAAPIGQGDAFASLLSRVLMKRAHAPKKIAPPVDKLKLVTPYPKARATMNETTLSTLVPVGTPIVLHLYTG